MQTPVKKKDPLAKKWECLIFTLKVVPNRVKEKFKVIGYKHFPSISLYGGLYEAGECTMFGTYNIKHERKYVKIFDKRAEQVIGISDQWCGEFKVCVIREKFKNRIQRKYKLGELCLFNSPETIEFNYNKSPVSTYIVEELREVVKSNKFKKDRSIEQSHSWGPLSRMIPGYRHIKSGKVQKNDYYWEDSYKNDGHWVRCDVSFSPIRVGEKIERRSIKFCDGTIKPERCHVFRYFNQFVIRKT